MAQPVIADDALLTDEYSVGLDELGRIRISPIDVSQFRRCPWGWLMAEKADIPLGLFERLQKIARERDTTSRRSACRR